MRSLRRFLRALSPFKMEKGIVMYYKFYPILWWPKYIFFVILALCAWAFNTFVRRKYNVWTINYNSFNSGNKFRIFFSLLLILWWYFCYIGTLLKNLADVDVRTTIVHMLEVESVPCNLGITLNFFNTKICAALYYVYILG